MLRKFNLSIYFLFFFYQSFSQSKGEQIYKTRCEMCHSGAVKEAPKIEALQQLTSESIIKSLESGVMKIQGASLTKEEKIAVSKFISKLSSTQTKVQSGLCDNEIATKNSKPIINNWGMGLSNKRAVDGKTALINSKNISKLQLKWAFGFADATRARCQPTIAGNTLFTSNPSGLIHALDLKTGCIQWTYKAEDEIRSAIVIGTDSKGLANRIYFSDFKANVYALDLKTRQLIWKKKMDEHPVATITGSLQLYKNRLYVPVSSTEVISAYNPKYECCTFRGSVVALDAQNGDLIWKTYTVDEPKPTKSNSAGTLNHGPSGAPVWSSPTIDTKRNLLYVGTGENYSQPHTPTSDAIIALSLDDGKIKWVKQALSRDAWNGACTNNSANCPENHGPDYDFGASPILVQRDSKQDIILAGQKSGWVFGLNPDNNGEIIWQQKVGRGGIMGGVHWGMASNDQTLFVPINDREAYPEDKDKPSKQGLHALNIENGAINWSLIEENRCKGDEKWNCGSGLSAAITLCNDVIFGGTLDGMIHAYSATDGKILWKFDTKRDFESVNGVKAFGGAIDSSGAVIVGNQLFINSGYAKFGEKAGNVLLCFEIK